MSTRFFTNAGENTLLNKFAGVFAHNPDLARFDALVGYLRASGYFALQPHLEKVPLIRILVGIDIDALLAASQRRGLLHLGDANKTLDEVRKELQRDIARAPYRKEVEDGNVEKARTNGSILMHDQTGKAVAEFNFENAWPLKVSGPAPNANSNELAMEEVEIICERLYRAT